MMAKKSAKGDEFFNLFVNGKNSASPKSLESEKLPPKKLKPRIPSLESLMEKMNK
jgi:hypothetical protein